MAAGKCNALNKLLRRGMFFTLRHKLLTTGIFFGALILSLLALKNASFKNDISRMLPDGSDSRHAYDQIRHCAMFNKAMILLESDDPGLFMSAEFAKSYDALARRIAGNQEYIARVDHRLFSSADILDVEKTLPYSMQLSTPDVLPAPEKLPVEVVKKLINPLSMLRSGSLHADPAEISGALFGKLNRFREISMMNTALDTPWIMSADRKYVLLTAECKLELSNPRSAGILQTLMDKEYAAANMPAGIKKHLILPHRRAEINELVIKKDVHLAVMLTFVLFGGLTLFFYRGDLRSLLIALLTLPAALISGGMLVKLFDEPQLFVLGLGGVITGIAVDYGIHIYGAMNNRWPYRTLTALLPSLFTGMITSAAAFMIFIFSPMAGVRQLGFFAGSALVFSLIFMLFFLPWCLKNKPRIPELPLYKIAKHKPHNKWRIAVYIVLTVISLILLFQLKINGDVRQYDMASDQCDEAELMVQKIFQNNRTHGIALVQGRSEQEVLEYAGKISHQDIFTIAELILPVEKQKKNLEAWKNFDLESYAAKLRKAAVRSGLPANYFDHFLQNIETFRRQKTLAPEPSWLKNIKNRLLVKGSDKFFYTLVLYREQSTAEEQLQKIKNCTIISRERLPKIMAQDIMSSILPTALAAVLAVLIMCSIYFKSTKKAVLALLPVAASLLFGLGFYALIGKGINIPVMAAGIVLCGLGVDYGIFVLHGIDSKLEKTVLHSITISAITTLAGGITTAFARHPMLHDAGITLMIGIFIAWTTAVFLLPCLYKKRDETC